MATTQEQLRLLHLEDNVNDQVLVREMLHRDGLQCDLVAVVTADEFENVLQREVFDLIISDFSLPSFDGLRALAVARKLSPHTPFIFFSGTIGEEVAVESLKNGAVDYVLKQRPHRLTGAVRNALQSRKERARLTRMEADLRQMEERLQIVGRATNDVVWDWDIQTDRIWFSENFQDVFGYPRHEIGTSLTRWQSLIHPGDRDRVVTGLTTVVAGGGRVWWSEHRVRRANGSWLNIYDRASVVYDASRKPLRVVGMAIDMTERKKAEEKIREQAALLDKAQDAIIVCNLDRSIIYWNKSAERIYGWRAEEAMGRNVRQLLLHGNSPPQIDEAVKKLAERGEWMGELTEFTRNNHPVIVQARATLIRDEGGQPKSLLIINTDITERKHLEEQFLRAQRLESLGALVGGIAHDLNNTLVPITVGVDILREQPLSPDAESMVRTMEASARRSAEMIRQMLIFARGGVAERMNIQGGQLLKEMGRTITDTFPKGIRSRVNVDKDLWTVSGFPTQIHQILMNLCVNARDAMPNGGTLTLSAENVNLPSDEAARHEVPAGNFVCLSVADTGTGIPEEILEKIFQPFFTTKGDQGTGLGLSTCQNIAKSHGGFIAVESKSGGGSKFEIYLPASGSPAEEAVPPQKPLPPLGNGERILVVDDEEAILAITRAALENYGYSVITANSGMEAVNFLSKHSKSISLLITDLAMPFTDGRATMDALGSICPDLKVILISGSEKGVRELMPQMKTDAFIPKPFTNQTLLETVHKVLLKESGPAAAPQPNLRRGGE